MKHIGKRLDVGDVGIYYELHGNGPPLALIAGLGTGTWLWDKQLPVFAKHFTTLVFDNRGVGKSDKPFGDYTVSMLASDLNLLLEKLNINKLHVLGVSLGGFIAQEFALTFPEKVDRLVLAATGCGGRDMIPMSENIRRKLLQQGASREEIRDKLTLAFSPGFLKSAEVEKLLDVRMANLQPYAAFLSQAHAGTVFDRSDDVQNISAPTFVLAATGDQIVPVENAYTLANKIPDCRLTIYQEAGHQFWVEYSEDFNRDVVDFLVTT